jgi:integration host factor subunit alpha
MSTQAIGRVAAVPVFDSSMNVKKTGSGRTLTRAALREAVYSCCTTLSRADARKILDATFEEISDALVRGEPVKLRSFGSFNVRSKRERIGRNPKTGVEATISPRRVLTFKPSPVLVAHVNGEATDGLEEEEYCSASPFPARN